MKHIQNFTDLKTWRESHKLNIEVYKNTDDFPKSEVFGLTCQIRKSVVSVSSNIAEGFSRQTYKDKLNFYHIALGSLTELQNQLLVARDVKFLSIPRFNSLARQTILTKKLIWGLIKSTKTRLK